MPTKNVLIIEDEPGQRASYEKDLKDRSFVTKAAESISQAKKLIEQWGDNVDLAILDMRLDKYPDWDGETGGALGLRLKERCIDFPPEFLIRSEYGDVDYYKDALDLGAAAYLSKKGTYPADVFRYVRALALRRSLKIENPNVIEQLNRVSATTRSEIDSITTFCENTLEPAFSDCLGARYVLLLTHKNETQNCATSADLPLGFQPVYEILQAMAHGNADLTTPYRFDPRHVDGIRTAEARHVSATLEGAVFVPLASVYEYRLSLGILGPAPNERFPEDAYELGAVLMRYVRSTICDNFIKILVQLDVKRRTTLGSTSQFCLFLGQDQLAMIEEGVDAGDLRSGSPTHQRLRIMAEDLEETGTILMKVAQSLDESGPSPVPMRRLIEETWHDLRHAWGLKGITFYVDGDCSVRADEVDLAIIVARVLQWLAHRRIATEPPHEPSIIVRCEADDRSARVIFEDRSRRLPRRLRERLFEPFTLAVQSARTFATPVAGENPDIENEPKAPKRRPAYLPLYLAKTLVEEKYSGWFEDKSDEIEGDTGHRLVMQFYRAYNSAAIPAIGYRP